MKIYIWFISLYKIQLMNEIAHNILDINKSVWVNANAGSGKTHLLTLRIKKMLLMGKSNILCLTFTNTTRDEM